MTTWMTLAEATKRFGVSRTTLFRLMATGQVERAKRTGDPKIYVSQQDVEIATDMRVRRAGDWQTIPDPAEQERAFRLWFEEWNRLRRHKNRAEQAFLRHLRSMRGTRSWLQRHNQLRERFRRASALFDTHTRGPE